MVDAVRRELEAAGQLDTPRGAVAVVLATAMCNPAETASGMAALSAELRRVMAEATGSAVVGADPLDELRRRRVAKLKGV